MKLLRYGQQIETLGKRYRLEGMLGSGGMADVCLAWDEVEQREVAIKLLKPDGIDQQTLSRFIKEAGQIVGWQHPHILRIYDHAQVEIIKHGNQESTLFYIVMEYANGGDLQKRMTQGEPYYSLRAAFTIFRQICGAVQYAHKNGIIHRDLKPLNILFRKPRTGPEEAVLSDFGLAVQVDASHHTFAHAGTLSYMAPEQFYGLAESASDIFALGVIIYQLLTGFLPFQRSFQSLDIENEREPLLPNVLNPALPENLNDPIMWALAANPDERYRTAQEFWNTLALALSQSVLPSERSNRQQVQPSAARLGEDGATLREDSLLPEPGISPPVLPVNNGPRPTASGSVTRQGGPRIIQLPDPDAASVPHVPKRVRKQPTPQHITHVVSPSEANATTSRTPKLVMARLQQTFQRRSSVVVPTTILTILVLIVVVLLGPLHLFAMSTTVTITPRSQQVQGNYPISAVTGIPDAAQHQIQARLLTASAVMQQATGPVSGTIPGTKAHGQLTFINNGATNITVPTMTFTGKSGVAVTFQGPITVTAIPASITVNAVAVDAGATGNIPAFDILENCCAAGTQIQVRNATKFSGGTDAVANSQVQQSDINNAAQPLLTSQTQAEQQKLALLIKSNEQVVANSAKCTPDTTADHNVGDSATSITVQVAVTCTEEVYDAQAAQSTALALLAAQAAKIPGTGYRLMGQALVHMQGTTIGNGQTVTVQMQAQGTYSYAFSAVMLHQLATLIAGKSATVANSLLLQQPGVANVQLNTTSTLPSNVASINLVVKQ
jgi:serine/threonine protein kinase